MKATLHFNLDTPEDQSAFDAALKGTDAHRVLWEVSQQVLRPHRKHGYSDEKLQKLIDKNKDACEIISILEKMFYDIAKEYDVKVEP